MNDPVADLLLEAEAEAGAEREERQIVLMRIAELRDAIEKLAAAVAAVSDAAKPAQNEKAFRVAIIERDENDRIKTFEIN